MAFFTRKSADFYRETSLLKASDIVAWKRARNIYNFKQLPNTAIISMKKSSFAKVVSPFTKRAKGIQGIHYIHKSTVLLCSEFGSGAPALLMLLEELRALGVEQFVFIGVAGIINDTIIEGQPSVITNVYTSSGASFFYSEKENIDCYDKTWFEKIKNACRLEAKIAWSTDAPYREVPSLIDYYKGKHCDFVEMECAALYSFSEFYKASAVSILIGADYLTSSEWKAPSNPHKLLETQQKLIAQLIKL